MNYKVKFALSIIRYPIKFLNILAITHKLTELGLRKVATDLMHHYALEAVNNNKFIPPNIDDLKPHIDLIKQIEYNIIKRIKINNKTNTNKVSPAIYWPCLDAIIRLYIFNINNKRQYKFAIHSSTGDTYTLEYIIKDKQIIGVYVKIYLEKSNKINNNKKNNIEIHSYSIFGIQNIINKTSEIIWQEILNF